MSNFKVAMNSGYTLLDSTGMNYMKQYNCDYSYLIIWNLISAAIGPYIAGLLVEENDDPTGL